MLFDEAAINIIKFSKIINIKQGKEKEFFIGLNRYITNL